MENQRFWAGFVWISGIVIFVWNVYVMFKTQGPWADRIFRVLMLLVILLITITAYAQWRKK